jgi:hypothetical protein
MSDLGLQPREVWKQPDQQSAEGRLGSSENTSWPRRCLFLFPAWPSLHMCHLFGIRSLYLDLDLGSWEVFVLNICPGEALPGVDP